MKLSIIIPVYNTEAWLLLPLYSVLMQTFRDFELILVDDGSQDGSEVICDTCAEGDSRVKVIHQKNAGVSAARNAGVAAAKGAYIGFVDADDLVEWDMYEVLLKVAEQENADIVQCQHDRWPTRNELPRSGKREVMDGKAFVRRMFEKQGGQYTNQVALWSKIFRRELFEGITFPVGRTYEDEQETYKLCLKAERIAEVPDILYHYIKRDNSIITGISSQKMLHKQAALLDRLQYLPEKMPELADACARSFLGYSETILCQMYARGDTQQLEQAVQVLLRRKKSLPLNKFEKLYLPLLNTKWGRKWILQNDFAPLQKRLRGRK